MKQFFKKLAFFTAFIIPSLVIAGFYLDGYWNFLAIVFSFLLIPVIDQSMGSIQPMLQTNRLKRLAKNFTIALSRTSGRMFKWRL